MSERLRIRLLGCDDETNFEVDVDETGKSLIKLLCKLSDEASEYSCQPVVLLREEAK